jgi:ferredoxin
MLERVAIDPDLCIGSGECVRLAPEAFVLDEDLGVSLPLPPADRLDEERLAGIVGACPTAAIAVRRTGAGGEA